MMGIAIDLDTWSRRDEVIAYSIRKGITLHQAVNELVNSGLSHYQGPPLHLGDARHGR